MISLTFIQKIFAYGVPILFAITLHEVAHGWVANQLGDPTARILGRLSINPLKHIDLIGTILVPLMLFLTTGFVFGWAKSVPINWRNLRSKRRDIALVALAGPLSNLIMALIWGLIIQLSMRLYLMNPIDLAIGMIVMGKIGIEINLVLLALNLIPIPPLDGSRVVASFLPFALAKFYARIEPFGFVILLLLLNFRVLGIVVDPIVGTLQNWIGGMFRLGMI